MDRTQKQSSGGCCGTGKAKKQKQQPGAGGLKV